MYVFRTIRGLRQHLQDQSELTIGFVPTMGALHPGHLSLLRESQSETDLSVVSIFVNPTQFNDPKDLEKYPRQTGQDLDLLYTHGCDIVFIPAVAEIYPPQEHTALIDLAGLDQMMEGKFRPGHFQGVAQVVKRLLDIVQPDALFMGQKDFQQLAVIGHVIAMFNMPVKLVMCPTIREPHGLAMSSRNLLLDPETRQKASVIHDTLTYAANHYTTSKIPDLEAHCMQMLDIPGFRPEYFEIADGYTLAPATEDTRYVVACCAVWAGNVRLIDNMILKESERVRT